MSRTAEPFTCQQQMVYSIVLLIISLCLVTHFLVEDVSIYRAVGFSSEKSFAAGLPFDEIGHQDDLVMAVSLPVTILHNDPPVIPAWNIHEQRQWAFPIRIPPKIA